VEQPKKSAFVVWIDPQEGPAGTTDRYCGRIEHVSSSTRERFSSREELLAFIDQFTLSSDEAASDDDSVV